VKSVRALLLVLLVLPGCISYCRFEPTLHAAARGDRAAIAEAGDLGRPRVPSTAEHLPPVREAFEAIAPGLSSTNAEMRLVALEALRHLAERAPDVYRNYFPGTFESPLSDPSPEVRWRAAWTHARLLESSDALRRAALDPDDLVAEAACLALGAAHDDEAFTVLLAALARPGPVERAARSALTRITGQNLPDAAAWKAYVEERGKLRGEVAPQGS
jgi:HEAT repeat protein